MPNNKRLAFLLSFFLFVLISLFVFNSARTASSFSWGSVLGDDDNEESEDKDDEDKEDEDKEDEDKEDEDKDREKEREREKKEEEKKREDEKKRSEKSETKSVTVNKDNTRTVTKKKIEDDGKVEIETKTYGADGRVIEETKLKQESDKDEIELETKTFSADGGKISELKFKSKDGEEFKLMVKNEDQSITKVRYDDEHNYVRIIGRNHPKNELEFDEDGIKQENEDENEESEESEDDVFVKIEDDGEYEIEHLGKTASVHFPLTIDDTDGSILLLTEDGEKKLTQLPGDISSKVEAAFDNVEVNEIEVKEKDNKLVYELSTERVQRILGLFETRVTSIISYDAETGEEIESPQSFWDSVLSSISF